VTLVDSGTAAAELEELAGRARELMDAAKAPNTVAAYASDWAKFELWCQQRGAVALPAHPAVVAMYLTDQAGVLAAATLERRLVSIADRHRAAGLESPTSHPEVRKTRKGIRRTFGTAQHRKAPIRTRDLRAMVATLDVGRMIGLRDRALLVLGYAGAFRRSELVALDVDDIEDTADGLVVAIRRSKTDQEGEGHRLGLPWGSDPSTCPVRTLRAWIDAAGITDGPVFRAVDRHGNVAASRLTERSVTAVTKRAASAAGIDPAKIGAHSLRAGLITSAIEAGAREHTVMRHSRHQSVSVFRGYVRDAGLFDDNAAAVVGL
jgi:site-specific recombinase XerD